MVYHEGWDESDRFIFAKIGQRVKFDHLFLQEVY